MNCAHHADQAAVAYCRTCGKPLCANCTRPVRGVIYCEDCLGARMEAGRVEAAAPAASFVSGTAGATPPPVPPSPVPAVSPSGPNPTVAGILGAIPLGIGAVYNGQYAKGLAHMCIFALLIAGCNANGELIPTISGFGIAFFIVYQIIDAVRSARAIQAGLPAPDPYGLGDAFGAGGKIDASRVPIGAVVLIILGVLFLLHTMGVRLGLDRFWPLLLIFLGAWLFARNYGLLGGHGDARACRNRLMGPALLFSFGVLFLLETLRVANWDRTWPIILLVIGGVKLVQSSTSRVGPGGNVSETGTGSSGATSAPSAPPPPAPPSEVSHG